MYVTTSSMEEANHIAEGLILKDLAACVNMIPQVKSMYKWEGAVETSQEVLLMIKVSSPTMPALNKINYLKYI